MYSYIASFLHQGHRYLDNPVSGHGGGSIHGVCYSQLYPPDDQVEGSKYGQVLIPRDKAMSTLKNNTSSYLSAPEINI